MAVRTDRAAAFGLAAAVLLISSAAARAEISGPVRTVQGKVQGAPAAADGVTVFKGIPFAAAPIGALRFQPAQPPLAWEGVRDGSKWGNTCIQPPAPTRAIGVNQATDMPDSPPMSEDCLNLNVWTGAKSAGERRPVMVWFYGGAYAEGGGSMPFADGTRLAARGAVVISINYRVGPFGFLSHPGLDDASPHRASGNQALSDAIAALAWVKANIAQFGGDPNNVTIFGQSAGACISAALVGSPVAKGLFNRAISQSGAWAGLTAASMMTRETAEANSVEALRNLGVHSLADLQALPAEKLAGIRAQGIVIDGWIVPEDLTKTFAEGRQNKVDVLLGSNANEGGSFAFGPPVTAESWKAGAEQRWEDLADRGLAAYPAETDDQARVAATRPFTNGIAWFMRHYADAQAGAGRKAWLYQFAHSPPAGEGKPSAGATHAAELAYMFDNLDKPREVPDPSSPEAASRSPADIELAARMASYWVNFARSGDPNGPGLPWWEPVTAMARNQAMLIDGGDQSTVGETMTGAQLEFHDALFARDVLGPLGL